MKLLNRLERTLSPLAIPHVTLGLVVLQSLMWCLLQVRPEIVQNLFLDRQLLLSGEWWRLVTFVFLPPMTNVLFLVFALWFFYFIGTTLENQWGAFRYNFYLLIAYLATIASVFIAPNGFATNAYIGGSVFLAFAFLYPDFQILIFFILPVKVKWLALLTWAAYVYEFAVGDWMTRATIVASVLNFFLFFGVDVFQTMKLGRRRMVRKIVSIQAEDEAINRCIVCGATERTNPKLEFRYCPQCKGTPCYCMPHMEGHVHRT
jgi:hypothetical protein